jgi:hypothetical protein
LHATAGTHTHNLKGAVLIFLSAGSEVNVSQCIEFVEHNIAVVGADTCGDTRDAFAFILTCDGMELTALDVALNAAFVEERSYHINATLVADQYHLIRQMFWANVKVEYTAVLIDNELASGESLLHR